MNRIRTASVVIMLGLSLGAAVSNAALSDRNQPISIEANTVTLDDRSKTSTYQGQVVLNQGTLAIRADRITVKQVANGAHHATVLGRPLTFRQKQESGNGWIEGQAERAEYDTRTQQLLLYTNARIKDPANEIRGNFISYDASTGFFKAGGASNSGGRVRVIIQPTGTATQRK